MPNFNADVRVAQIGTPPVKTKTNKSHGRLRVFESSITVPAGTVIGDTITWGEIPPGSRVWPHLSRLRNTAGAASSTINVGDASSATRYLGATSVASAAVTPLGDVASYEVTNENKVITSVVAGAGLLAGQTITLNLFYALD